MYGLPMTGVSLTLGVYGLVALILAMIGIFMLVKGKLTRQ